MKYSQQIYLKARAMRKKHTITYISKELGIGTTTIWRWTNDMFDIEPVTSYRQIDQATRAKAIKFRKAGYTLREVEMNTGVSGRTVIRWVRGK